MNESTVQPMTGRCLCGAVRYVCGPLLDAAAFCHCESCRRASGAHSVAWLTVRGADFSYTAGAPRRFASSPGVQREFCPQCGSPLTYRNARRPDEVDVILCSLDRPAGVVPADHVWMRDALPWDAPHDGRVQHPAGRTATAVGS